MTDDINYLDGIDYLNDDLYHSADDTPLWVIRWPPRLNEIFVTKRDLLTRLRPAPLPVPPPVPPVEPPPPVAVDRMVVAASAGLTIRAQPSPAAESRGKIEAMTSGAPTEVDVQGHHPAKAADGATIDYGLLVRVNGLKYADVGFIARSKGADVYLVPKA